MFACLPNRQLPEQQLAIHSPRKRLQLAAEPDTSVSSAEYCLLLSPALAMATVLRSHREAWHSDRKLNNNRLSTLSAGIFDSLTSLTSL